MSKEIKDEHVSASGVLESALEDIIADRFARYSRHIIQERALPDARDGLKPVQRRILYAMYEAGNTSAKPYHKSAKTVGNVIGNYHPHGDSSVYDAMVRLSQPWKINIPLIDMQGNNGSIDDDPAAAMRYTECRLAALSDNLLEDLDKDTVEWAPNFSDEKMEPTLLPARYPNLLTHGISGIAAGYATNIPPHNLAEVIAAAIYRIRHPKSSLDELMKHIPGPDFPTGGTVLSLEGIRQAFETGKGKIFVRAKASIEETKTIQQIIITEIPYEVVKSSLVRRIDDLRLSGKLAGVLDVRDESGRDGLRIAIDLKKEAPAQEILNYLYKNSDLQISYSYNMIAIVNQSPRQLSLTQALDVFIDHRRTIITRRSQYLLNQANKQAHILEGLIKAVSVMDEIIAIIRQSKDKADSKNRIIERFKFTSEQAEAIVTMRLYRLSNTDIKALEKDYADLEKEIRRLEGILKSSARLDTVMVKELEAVKNAFGIPRKTKISHGSPELVVDAAAMIPDEPVMVSVSRDGYVKRASLRSYGSSTSQVSAHKDNDVILGQSQTSTRSHMLIFTDRGKSVTLDIYQIPEAKWKDLGSHLSSLVKLEPNEKIAAAVLYESLPEGIDVLLATKNGYVKRIALEEFSTLKPLKPGWAIKVSDLDSLVGAVFSEDENDIAYLITENGMSLSFPANTIPASGTRSRGVIGMNVAEDDSLMALFAKSGEHAQFLIWNQTGGLKRLKGADFASAARRAKGSRLFRQDKKNPLTIAGALPVHGSMPLPFVGDEYENKKASAIPLSLPTGGFHPGFAGSAPEVLLPLEQLKKTGTWQKVKEPVQQSLFGENE